MKYVREGDFLAVDIEKGMQDGQVQSNCSVHFLDICAMRCDLVCAFLLYFVNIR